MKYLEEITTDRTWICERTGVYKVTCVGGGSTGVLTIAGSMFFGKGGITKFGDMLSANGGTANGKGVYIDNNSDSANIKVGGVGGYTAYCYGGAGVEVRNTSNPYASSASLNGGNAGVTGYGYGAGGGAEGTTCRVSCTNTSGTATTAAAYFYPLSGEAGDLRVGIFELKCGQSIPIQIGDGGIKDTMDFSNVNTLLGSILTSYRNLNFSSANIGTCKANVTNGLSGICVIEYLGDAF